MYKFNTSYDLYINGTKIKRYYSKRKAIDIALTKSRDLFLGQRHIEVVNTLTSEIIFNT